MSEKSIQCLSSYYVLLSNFLFMSHGNRRINTNSFRFERCPYNVYYDILEQREQYDSIVKYNYLELVNRSSCS